MIAPNDYFILLTITVITSVIGLGTGRWRRPSIFATSLIYIVVTGLFVLGIPHYTVNPVTGWVVRTHLAGGVQRPQLDSDDDRIVNPGKAQQGETRDGNDDERLTIRSPHPCYVSQRFDGLFGSHGVSQPVSRYDISLWREPVYACHTGKNGAGATPSSVTPAAPSSHTSTPTGNKATGATKPALPTDKPSVYYRNQVVALMYHDVQAKHLPGDVVSPHTFAEELALMKKENFHVVSLSQVTNFLQGKEALPNNAVLITFDNGYQSVYQNVYPLLKQYHDPATLFAIVSWLSPPHKKGLFRSLTWTEVTQIYKSGLLTVESQTYNLHHAAQVGSHTTSPASVARIYNPATGTRESLAAYKARVYADVKRARDELMARLHEPNVNAFCYPFGDYNPAFIQVLHRAGYGTCSPHPMDGGSHNIPTLTRSIGSMRDLPISRQPVSSPQSAKSLLRQPPTHPGTRRTTTSRSGVDVSPIPTSTGALLVPRPGGGPHQDLRFNVITAPKEHMPTIQNICSCVYIAELT